MSSSEFGFRTALFEQFRYQVSQVDLPHGCYAIRPEPEGPRTIVYTQKFLHELKMLHYKAACEATSGFIPVQVSDEELLAAFVISHEQFSRINPGHDG